MSQASIKRLCHVVAFSAAALSGLSVAHGKVELLNQNKMLLTGTISRGDMQKMADLVLAEDSEIKDLVVSARGTGATSWEVVHDMSRLLADHDIKVELLYAEDAAIAIRGMGQPIRRGKQIGWKKVDIDRNKEISVRVYEREMIDGKYVATSRTDKESLASTVDQFDFICKERIPQEARELGITASEVVGEGDDFTNRKGIRDETGHVWYYVRTNGRGVWRHAEPHDITKVVEKARKSAQTAVDRLRKQNQRKP